MPVTLISGNLGINVKTIKKIIYKFVEMTGSLNYADNKLWGTGKIVQIEKTMLTTNARVTEAVTRE